MTQTTAPIMLIVDDDPLTLMYAAGVMENAGFQVIEAVNGDDAIAILNHNRDIAAMFIDVRIPGSCDGLELARRARDLFPSARVVLTSAYDRPDADQIVEIGTFISKPYFAEEIAHWVQAGTH